MQLCRCYSVTSFWTQSRIRTAYSQTDFLCLDIICASTLSSRQELGGMRMGLYSKLSNPYGWKGKSLSHIPRSKKENH